MVIPSHSPCLQAAWHLPWPACRNALLQPAGTCICGLTMEGGMSARFCIIIPRCHHIYINIARSASVERSLRVGFVL